MYDLEDLIPKFPNREESLQGISRFRRIPMIYRTNLDDHQRMVYWMTEELLETTKGRNCSNDERLAALTLALVHDDVEIITGDLQYGDRLLMSDKEIQDHEDCERVAIEFLAKRFPTKINGLNYRDNLLQALYKNTSLSQRVSYADKLVGFGESWHELYSGNKHFLVDVEIGNTPTLTYMDIFRNRNEQWPLLKEMFRQKHPLLNLPKISNIVNIVADGKPFDEDSIRKKTGNPIYDCYKEVMLKRGGERGKNILLEAREEPSELSWAQLNERIRGILPDLPNQKNLKLLQRRLQPYVNS